MSGKIFLTTNRVPSKNPGGASFRTHDGDHREKIKVHVLLKEKERVVVKANRNAPPTNCNLNVCTLPRCDPVCSTPLPILSLCTPLPVTCHNEARQTFECDLAEWLKCKKVVKVHDKCKIELLPECKYLKENQFVVIRVTFQPCDGSFKNLCYPCLDVPCVIYIGDCDEKSQGKPTYRFSPVYAKSCTQSLLEYIEERLCAEPFCLRISCRPTPPCFSVSGVDCKDEKKNNNCAPTGDYSIPNMFVGEGYSFGLRVDPNAVDDDQMNCGPNACSPACCMDLHRQVAKFQTLLATVFCAEICDPGLAPSSPPFVTMTQVCVDDVVKDMCMGKCPSDGRIDVNFRPLFAMKTLDLEALQIELAFWQAKLANLPMNDPARPAIQAKITELQTEITTVTTSPNREMLALRFTDQCGGVQEFPCTNLLEDACTLIPLSKNIVIQHQQFFGIQAAWCYRGDRDCFELSHVKLFHREDSEVVPLKLNVIKDQIEKKIKFFFHKNVNFDHNSTIATD